MNDMRITVGHIVDNPNFMFVGDFEITTTRGFDVYTLYESRKDNPGILSGLVNNPVTYMVVNEKFGRLRIEI